MMGEEDDEVDDLLTGTLTFSEKQIEYLRSEFERQRRWVKSLSDREAAALAELEKTRGSVSYRVGRALTWPIRKILKILNNPTGRIFLWGTKVEAYEQDIFSPFIISPELLPESGSHGIPDVFIQDMLLSIRIGALSVNEIKDEIFERSFEMDNDLLLDCLIRITRHAINTREYHGNIKNMFVGSFRSLVLKEPILAVRYYDEFGKDLGDARADKTLVQTLVKLGYVKRAKKVLDSMKNDSWAKETKSDIKPMTDLVDKGFSGEFYKKRSWRPNPGSVVYFASQTMPYTTSGYAIRTHGLVRSIRDLGHDITVCARHGYPLDRADFKGEYIGNSEDIDGIRYLFNTSNRSDDSPEIPYGEVFNFRKYEEYHYLACETLARQVEEIRPFAIHAASNFVTGMAAVNTAKALGIPSIYEIRGFWHLTQASKRKGYEDSDHYHLSEALELEVASNADHVFVITQALADILIDYGVDENKITILPNSVDVGKFNPMDRDPELEDYLEAYDRVVLGYIGSFVEYEGLDLLLEAIASIRKDIDDQLRVILVGDGPVMKELREMSKFLGIDDIVKFTGRVSHDEVQRYYSIVDIMAFPRKGRRVCELVSPLKPFEAMAMEKAVIASDVRALAEIVDDGKTGLLHKKDDSSSLAECIKMLIEDSDLRASLSKAGREWVKEHRSSKAIAGRVTQVYENLALMDPYEFSR
jgi:glycosyltransferase involved in cell wall biosynthesis